MRIRSLNGVLIEDSNFSLTSNCFQSQKESMYALQKDPISCILRCGKSVVPEYSPSLDGIKERFLSESFSSVFSSSQ